MHLAHIFTKSMLRPAFETLRSKLGVGILQLPSLCRGGGGCTKYNSNRIALEPRKKEMDSGLNNNQTMGLHTRQSPLQQSHSQDVPNVKYLKQNCKNMFMKKTERAGNVVLNNTLLLLSV